MSSIRDQVIIERLRRIIEKADKHGSPTPNQYLRVIAKYKEVLDRNGLIDEFKGFLDEIDRDGSMSSAFDSSYKPPRETILNSETKASRPPRETILNSETKALRPPRETILNSETKASRPPRETILSSFPSIKNTITSHTKYFTSQTTYVNSHIRRNKNGTISIVRGHTRRT